MHKSILLLAAALISTPLFAAETNDIWGTFQGNAAHTGYSNTTVKPDAIKLLWSRSLTTPDKTGMSLGQPIVVKDNIYFHTHTYSFGNNTHYPDSLLTLNSSTGETRWKTDLDLTVRSSAMTYDDHKIYMMLVKNDDLQRKLSSSNIFIAAFNADNGSNIFAVPATLSNGTDSWYSQAPVIVNHQLFLGTANMQLAANADNGRVKWRSGDVSGVDNIAVVNKDYVIRYMNNALSLLSRHSGKLVRTIKGADVSDWEESIPLVLNEQQNIVYAAFDNREDTRQLTAIDLTKNQVLWKLDIPAFIRQPVYANGMLYFIQRERLNYDQSTLYAVDASAGTVMWTLPINANVDTDPIVTNNAIMIYSDDNLSIISLDTHQIIKTINTIGSGYMAVANNTLYFTDVNFYPDSPETIFVNAYSLN